MAEKAEQSQRSNLTRTENLPSTQSASAKDRITRVAKPVKNSEEAQERDSGIYQESGETIVLQDDDEIEVNPTEVSDDEVNARIHGTWTMIWGNKSYDFVDGRRYKIPRDLFNYLRAHRNIYETM